MNKELYKVFDDRVPSIMLQCKYKKDLPNFFCGKVDKNNVGLQDSLLVDEKALREVGLYIKSTWKSGLCRTYKNIMKNESMVNDKDEKLEYCKHWVFDMRKEDGSIRFMATPLFFDEDDFKSLIETGSVVKTVKGEQIEFTLSKFEYGNSHQDFYYLEHIKQKEPDWKNWRWKIVDGFKREVKQLMPVYENRLKSQQVEQGGTTQK